jgi:hypothetical protein
LGVGIGAAAVNSTANINIVPALNISLPRAITLMDG